MTQQTFTWVIQAKTEKTMSVLYTWGEYSRNFNIPIPDVGADLEAHVNRFAPVREWQRIGVELMNVEGGTTGSGTFETPT